MEVSQFQGSLVCFQNILEEDPGSFHLPALPTSACWLLTSCLSLSSCLMVAAAPSFPLSPEEDIPSLHPWSLQWTSHDSLARLAAQAISKSTTVPKESPLAWENQDSSCRVSPKAHGCLMPASKLVEAVGTGRGCWLGYQWSVPGDTPSAYLAELSRVCNIMTKGIQLRIIAS